MFISYIMRAVVPQDFLDGITQPGFHPIDLEVLPPREIAVSIDAEFKGRFIKDKRNQGILTMSRAEAERLVAEGKGSYEAQRLLVYSMADYLADKDVLRNSAELSKATAAANQGETLVAVAVVGESRGPITVLRNVVSGCQNPDELVEEAQKALDKSTYVSVED